MAAVRLSTMAVHPSPAISLGSSRPCPNHRPFPPAAPRSYLVTCYAVDWERQHMWINSVALVVTIVAKLPEMHGVRLFQINAARVD